MWRKLSIPGGVLLLIVVAQGLYASWLNRLYYTTYGPFFDSVAYTNVMANILTIAKRGSILRALERSMHSGTVSLPWMLVALVSPLIGYSRLVGVWLQEFWAFILCLSVFVYFYYYRGTPRWISVLWTLPFISFLAIYRFNGGISDFRMDLTLYLLLATMSTWYLATYHTESTTPWILSGLFLALAIMNRATTPAYAGFVFLPLLFVRWLAHPETRLLLARRVTLFWGAGALLGSIPVVVNWKFIHYYYFLWGADPTAHLPLAESSRHFTLANDSVGTALLVASRLMLAVRLGVLGLALRKVANPVSGFLKAIDWKIAYLALAPSLLLALTGAGLNPFVSLPSVFGILLFGIVPVRGKPGMSAAEIAVTVLLVLACARNPWNGYVDHIRPEGKAPRMAALKRGIVLMRNDAHQRGRTEVEFATSHIVDFMQEGLTNVMIYDFGATHPDNALAFPDGLVIRETDQFNAPRPINWAENLPNGSDAEKYNYLLGVAETELDYMFLPDDPSIDWMEKNRTQNFSNLKVRGLKKMLLATGHWCAVGEPLVASGFETVQLYARRPEPCGDARH